MNRARMEELSEKRKEQREGVYQVAMTAPNRFLLNGHQYVVQRDYRAAFDPTAFADRFSPLLSKYDYLVGDWGYGQLRLRGFYAPANPQFDPDRGVATVMDYLYEECNFGCPYFVVQNLEVQPPRHPRRAASNRRKNRGRDDKARSQAGQGRRRRRRRTVTDQEGKHG